MLKYFELQTLAADTMRGDEKQLVIYNTLFKSHHLL